MSRVIRKNLGPFTAILVLVALAAVVGSYILNEQRFRFPLAEPTPFRVNVEIDNAQAVTPGQGQTAQVAGVRIGDIAEVKLRDGRASIAPGHRAAATATSSTATRAPSCARARA